MTDSTQAIPEVAALEANLNDASETVKLQAIQQLAAAGEAGLDILQRFLHDRKADPPTPADGKAYQVLFASGLPATIDFLQRCFPEGGVVPLRSQRNIDYSPLQQHLIKQEFQAADKLTIQKLCELAGEDAVNRKWLYFSEVDRFPVTDLQTVDALWRIYSEGKFGYSVQRELWLAVGKNWDKLWVKLDWKQGNEWMRYPDKFTWNLSAPRGHLPLSNQLRGVRVLASTLNHPAWTNGIP